jgi:hypothetical protein
MSSTTRSTQRGRAYRQGRSRLRTVGTALLIAGSAGDHPEHDADQSCVAWLGGTWAAGRADREGEVKVAGSEITSAPRSFCTMALITFRWFSERARSPPGSCLRSRMNTVLPRPRW